MVRRAQLIQHQDVDERRYQFALQTLHDAEKATLEWMRELETALNDHEANGKEPEIKAGAIGQTDHLDPASPENDPAKNSSDKGKGKDLERNREGSVMDSNDTDPAREEHEVKKRTIQSRLRECRLTYHRIKFLLGDVYHVLGESHANEEKTAYEVAEEIRRILLKRQWIQRCAIRTCSLWSNRSRREC